MSSSNININTSNMSSGGSSNSSGSSSHKNNNPLVYNPQQQQQQQQRQPLVVEQAPQQTQQRRRQQQQQPLPAAADPTEYSLMMVDEYYYGTQRPSTAVPPRRHSAHHTPPAQFTTTSSTSTTTTTTTSTLQQSQQQQHRPRSFSLQPQQVSTFSSTTAQRQKVQPQQQPQQYSMQQQQPSQSHSIRSSAITSTRGATSTTATTASAVRTTTTTTTPTARTPRASSSTTTKLKWSPGNLFQPPLAAEPSASSPNVIEQQQQDNDLDHLLSSLLEEDSAALAAEASSHHTRTIPLNPESPSQSDLQEPQPPKQQQQKQQQQPNPMLRSSSHHTSSTDNSNQRNNTSNKMSDDEDDDSIELLPDSANHSTVGSATEQPNSDDDDDNNLGNSSNNNKNNNSQPTTSEKYSTPLSYQDLQKARVSLEEQQQQQQQQREATQTNTTNTATNVNSRQQVEDTTEGSLDPLLLTATPAAATTTTTTSPTTKQGLVDPTEERALPPPETSRPSTLSLRNVVNMWQRSNRSTNSNNTNSPPGNNNNVIPPPPAAVDWGPPPRSPRSPRQSIHHPAQQQSQNQPRRRIFMNQQQESSPQPAGSSINNVNSQDENDQNNRNNNNNNNSSGNNDLRNVMKEQEEEQRRLKQKQEEEDLRMMEQAQEEEIIRLALERSLSDMGGSYHFRPPIPLVEQQQQQQQSPRQQNRNTPPSQNNNVANSVGSSGGGGSIDRHHHHGSNSSMHYSFQGHASAPVSAPVILTPKTTNKQNGESTSGPTTPAIITDKYALEVQAMTEQTETFVESPHTKRIGTMSRNASLQGPNHLRQLHLHDSASDAVTSSSVDTMNNNNRATSPRLTRKQFASSTNSGSTMSSGGSGASSYRSSRGPSSSTMTTTSSSTAHGTIGGNMNVNNMNPNLLRSSPPAAGNNRDSSPFSPRIRMTMTSVALSSPPLTTTPPGTSSGRQQEQSKLVQSAPAVPKTRASLDRQMFGIPNIVDDDNDRNGTNSRGRSSAAGPGSTSKPTQGTNNTSRPAAIDENRCAVAADNPSTPTSAHARNMPHSNSMGYDAAAGTGRSGVYASPPNDRRGGEGSIRPLQSQSQHTSPGPSMGRGSPARSSSSQSIGRGPPLRSDSGRPLSGRDYVIEIAKRHLSPMEVELIEQALRAGIRRHSNSFSPHAADPKPHPVASLYNLECNDDGLPEDEARRMERMLRHSQRRLMSNSNSSHSPKKALLASSTGLKEQENNQKKEVSLNENQRHPKQQRERDKPAGAEQPGPTQEPSTTRSPPAHLPSERQANAAQPPARDPSIYNLEGAQEYLSPEELQQIEQALRLSTESISIPAPEAVNVGKNMQRSSTGRVMASHRHSLPTSPSASVSPSNQTRTFPSDSIRVASMPARASSSEVSSLSGLTAFTESSRRSLGSPEIDKKPSYRSVAAKAATPPPPPPISSEYDLRGAENHLTEEELRLIQMALGDIAEEESQGAAHGDETGTVISPPVASMPKPSAEDHLSEEDAAAIERALKEADEAEERRSRELAIKIFREDESLRMANEAARRQQGNVRTMTRDELIAEQAGHSGPVQLSSSRPWNHLGMDDNEGVSAGFRLNASSRQEWSRRDQHSVIGPNHEIRTKHDEDLDGQANAHRLGLEMDDGGTLPKVGGRAYNSFVQSMNKQNKKGVAAHGTGRAGSDSDGTRQGAMDANVRLQISSAINGGLIQRCNGVVKEGKEAIVYHADKGPASGGFDVAIKVFKRIQEFRGRADYVDGDPRYAGNAFRNSSGREQLEMWAEKEFRNLIRANRAGVPVATPLLQKDNILFMRFLGINGWPAPQLREINIRPGGKKWKTLYQQVMVSARRLYQEGRLVHGDLSEYNILAVPIKLIDHKYPNVEDEEQEVQAVLIDFGQAVDPRHPEATRLLERDMERVGSFFSGKGVDTLNLEESMNFILAEEEQPMPSSPPRKMHPFIL